MAQKYKGNINLTVKILTSFEPLTSKVQAPHCCSSEPSLQSSLKSHTCTLFTHCGTAQENWSVAHSSLAVQKGVRGNAHRRETIQIKHVFLRRGELAVVLKGLRYSGGFIQ